jgi:hypothetical protein
MIRLQNIAITNQSVQITYVEPADNDTGSGVMEARILDLPHEIVPQAFVDELLDIAVQLIDHGRAVRRLPRQDLRDLIGPPLP